MKKSSIKSTKTRKTPQKRKPRTKKKTTKSNIFALSNILVLITILALSITGYFYNENQKLIEEKNNQIKQNRIYKEKLAREEEYHISKEYEEKTKALDIEYVSHIDSNIYLDSKKPKTRKLRDDLFDQKEKVNSIQKPKVVVNIEPKIKEKLSEIKKIVVNKPKQAIISHRPKLAIIIDDISTQHQINLLKNVGYIVNASFLPPNKSRTHTVQVASKLDHYMIHLPMQASSNRFDEKKTLHIEDSISKIEKRILEVRKLYPKATFINNHTGSKFTSNKKAMDKLYQILKKYNFTFVDSRTTSHSVANLSAKKYGVRTLSRSVFLDNKKDEKYIIKQLKKAIKIARKNGSAIAIGHPYTITFKTLQKAKKYLDGIDVVYVEQL